VQDRWATAAMTREEADRLAEGDRVKSRKLRSTVVGTTPNCVSIHGTVGKRRKYILPMTCGTSAGRGSRNDQGRRPADQ
jgi:hypothetical protein